MPVVPYGETNVLLITIRAAIALASEGHADEGYVAILAGLRRAEGIQSGGHPWGTALVLRWQGVLAGYAERHSIGRA